MSNDAAERAIPPVPPEWERLELSVRRLLDDYETWRRRAREAEARIEELESTLTRVSSGSLDPVALGDRVKELESENVRLRGRIEAAAEHLRRTFARIQFIEEER